MGTCAQAAIAMYPDAVRAELGIAPELTILCGLAIGYPDPDFPANRIHTRRNLVSDNVVFIDE